jgi:methylenetetrahydrofolate dehydrogenase (NADP+)/methenyltetrahydrofolate cyclohydrolase
MPATLLDGTAIAAEIKSEVAEQVRQLSTDDITPGLAAVLVGSNPASEIYVRNKIRACAQLGIYSKKITPSETISTEGLLAVIRELNEDDRIDGILVQLPLPKQVDSKAVLLAVAPDKDVDGFHPINIGRLSAGRPHLVPCTPAGVIEILKRSGIPIKGQDAVVIGRSDIVGKPAAMLLLNESATVTVCHSQTHNLLEHTRAADILIAAIGRAAFVTREMVKPGATVIDVGINRIHERADLDLYFKGDAKRAEEFAKRGSTVIGDVHPQVASVAGALTPVPGGVGPLTIAMLMSNTVKAAKLRRGNS